MSGVRRLAFAAVCLAGPAWGTLAAAEAEWGRFRGPTEDGRTTVSGLPIEWSPDKNILWKTPVPGVGWSSPVTAGGKIVLTSAVPVDEPGSKDLSLRTLCLDGRDGKVLWDVEVFRQDGSKAPKIHSKNSHASPTPILDGDRIYVHFGHQGTACLDFSGKLLWDNRSLGYKPVHGNGGSPILVDDLLIFSIDGGDKRALVALDQATGKVRWQTERPGDPVKKFSFCTPTLIVHNGRRQVVSPASDVVVSCDPTTGRELWRFRYTGYSVIPKPVYGHGMIYFSTGYDTPSVLAVKVDGEGDVTDTHLGWTVKRGAPNTPSLVLDGDELYLVSDRGIATCLDAKTGEQVWQERIGGNFSASPLLAEGRLYLLSEEGVTTVVKAGRTFEKLATDDLEERSLASCAVLEKSLLLRTEKHLYRIGAK